MSHLPLDQVKLHLSVDEGFAEHDGLIQNYIDAAEAWIAKYLRRDLLVDYPDGWPDHALQAARFLVGHYYAHREAVVSGGSVSSVPMAVTDLLASERDLSA